MLSIIERSDWPQESESSLEVAFLFHGQLARLKVF